MFSLGYLIPYFEIESSSWEEADSQSFGGRDSISWVGGYWCYSHGEPDVGCHARTWERV